ncbi:hypothetical protein SGLAM104S_06175 [Streptomyces glaucescens]
MPGPRRHRPSTKYGRNWSTRWRSRSSPISGLTDAAIATPSATGSGQRIILQTGVLSRHRNSAHRNQVRYQGSSRVMS